MEGEACPGCGSTATVAGSTYPNDWVPLHFRPLLKRNLRYWLVHCNQHTGVEIPEGLRTCLDCGLVWGRIAPDELRDFVGRERLAAPPLSKAAESEL